jgi:ATP-dependent DNA helicase DinG
VVAVFDPRLGTKNYRREILAAMPPMRRSTTRSEVEEFLRHITR